MPGTTFTGPITIVGGPNDAAFATLVTQDVSLLTGTADAGGELQAIGDTSTVDQSTTIEGNFATLAAAINALQERIQ